MAGVYRSVDSDGRVTYSDYPPPGSQRVDVVDPARRTSDNQDSRSSDYQRAKTLISEAQKRIPKLVDYLDYLDYLRRNSPRRFDKVMLELKEQDPQTWLKLQKFPQFRPLRDTALGLKAGAKHLTAGAGFIGGSIAGNPGAAGVGSAEKWLETTIKDMMKRDRFGPYAPVLGTKASTLPEPKPPTYSNSRLGQYLKTEDPRAAKEAAKAAKALENSRTALRTGFATALSRVGTPILNAMTGALDVDVFRGMSAIEGMRLGKELVQKGILTQDEAYELRGMMARGEFDKVRELIDNGMRRAQENR